MPETFEQITINLSQAVRAALEREARVRGVDVPDELSRHDWVAGPPADVGERAREIFATAPPLALLAFDTPGIQSYIFKANRPVDIFGASRLVADFTDSDYHDDSRPFALYSLFARQGLGLDRKSMIYAGGGGGLLILAASQVKEVASAIESLLEEATGGDLASTTACLEVWPDELGGGPVDQASLPMNDDWRQVLPGLRRGATRYAETLAGVMAKLMRQRSARTRLAELIRGEEIPWLCTTCNGRVDRSSRLLREQDRRAEVRCQPCQDRREHGGRGKRVLDQARTFADLVAGREGEQPEDGADKAMAVIYADGANVGQAFLRVATMAQHRALSQVVDATFERARRRAAAHSPPFEASIEPDRMRVQTPLCGGDDLVLILPAEAAMAAARDLVDEVETAFDLNSNPLLAAAFENASDELRGQISRFGVGVGIAIADYDFPVQFLLDYATQLLKLAKGRIRVGDCRSAVDFLVLTSGTPLNHSIRALRRTPGWRRAPQGGEPGLRLTRRPYSRSDFESFLDRAGLMAQEVPTSQIHGMARELRRGHAPSRSLWRYQHARSERWTAYREALGCPLERVDALLWENSQPPDGLDCTSPWLASDLLDTLELLSLRPKLGPPPKGVAA